MLCPYAQESWYVAPVVSNPTISYDDANGITAILKAVAPLVTPKSLNKFHFNDSDISFATQQLFNIIEANITCNFLLIYTINDMPSSVKLVLGSLKSIEPLPSEPTSKSEISVAGDANIQRSRPDRIICAPALFCSLGEPREEQGD
jgi:hypothetical protein